MSRGVIDSSNSIDKVITRRQVVQTCKHGLKMNISAYLQTVKVWIQVINLPLWTCRKQGSEPGYRLFWQGLHRKWHNLSSLSCSIEKRMTSQEFN